MWHYSDGSKKHHPQLRHEKHTHKYVKNDNKYSSFINTELPAVEMDFCISITSIIYNEIASGF